MDAHTGGGLQRTNECVGTYTANAVVCSVIGQVMRKAVANRVLTLIGNPVAIPTSSSWLQTSLLYFDGVFSSTSNWRALLSCVAFRPLVDMACRVAAAEPAWVEGARGGGAITTGEKGPVPQGRRGQCHRGGGTSATGWRGQCHRGGEGAVPQEERAVQHGGHQMCNGFE